MKTPATPPPAKPQVNGCLANTVLWLTLPIVMVVGGLLWAFFGSLVVGTVKNAKAKYDQEREAVAKYEAAKAEEKRLAELPSVFGWTLSEVVSRHGEPVFKDKETGWARWGKFEVRFENGVAVDVRG